MHKLMFLGFGYFLFNQIEIVVCIVVWFSPFRKITCGVCLFSLISEWSFPDEPDALTREPSHSDAFTSHCHE